jgi:hypothetical protein
MSVAFKYSKTFPFLGDFCIISGHLHKLCSRMKWKFKQLIHFFPHSGASYPDGGKCRDRRSSRTTAAAGPLPPTADKQAAKWKELRRG